MKILFIINSLKKKSGSERVAIELSNKLFKLFSYNITLINRDTLHTGAAYEINKNIKVLPLYGNTISFFIKLQKHIFSNNYDVVVIHNMGKLSILCTFLLGIKKLVSLEHVSFSSRSKWIKLLSKYLYSRIDQVVTLTQKDKQQFDFFHKNCTVIPNFSPFLISASPRGNKKVLAIGRLTEQKNFLHLLKAWEKIAHRIPDWSLHIYGEGEQKSHLSSFITKNRLQNIYLKDVISNISDTYKTSDFFVLSSKYEGLPMVLIEAQSFGLPIISYDCPCGPQDIIKNGYNGFLVKNQNIDILAEKILTLATSPSLLGAFSKNSLKNAKYYQYESIIQIWKSEVFEK